MSPAFNERRFCISVGSPLRSTPRQDHVAGMLLLSSLRSVPAFLLVLLCSSFHYTQGREISWPLASLLSRSLSQAGIPMNESINSEAILKTLMPVGVRKMSGDQGEMFYPEYWSFDSMSDHDAQLILGKRKPNSRQSLYNEDKSRDLTNSSIPIPFQVPFALHAREEPKFRPNLGHMLKSPRAIFSLDKRSFQCPGGTFACTSINAPNSCCLIGTTCSNITDTGYGDVACCEQGEICSGNVNSCPSGDTVCSEASGSGSTGGGCCIPGFTCNGSGCTSSFSCSSP